MTAAMGIVTWESVKLQPITMSFPFAEIVFEIAKPQPCLELLSRLLCS